VKLSPLVLRPQVGPVDRLILGIARNDNCHGKTEALGQKFAPLSFCARQIPHEIPGIESRPLL
jgi:hypothetical protein